MVHGSHKHRIRHTKGGEVRIKRTAGLSGRIGNTKGGEVHINWTMGLSSRIGCSCASSVILLMVAHGSGDHASHGHVSSVVAIGECTWAHVCTFGRACMLEWGMCGHVCCHDVVMSVWSGLHIPPYMLMIVCLSVPRSELKESQFYAITPYFKQAKIFLKQKHHMRTM
jgi:hypothetical protein